MSIIKNNFIEPIEPILPRRLMAAVCSAIHIIGHQSSQRCYSSPNLVQFGDGVGGGATTSSGLLTTSIESAQSSSSTEVIRNISEWPPIDVFTTSAVLHYCKRKILVPYQRFLSLLGWRSPISMQNEHCFCSVVLVRLHILFVIFFTLLGYVLQYAACFRRDVVGGYKLILKSPVLSEVDVKLDASAGSGSDSDSSSRSLLMSDSMVCKGTAIGLYMMPDLLHLAAYFYTFYLLRWCESEQLQILMERVFLQAFYSRSNFITQPKLVKTLRVFLSLSLGWIALSTCVQIFHVLAEFPFFTWMQPSQKNVEGFLIVLLVLSMTWNDIIQVTIIMSYSIQCQLLNSFIRGLCERVREKSIQSLQEAIKEINESSKILKHLNDDFSISVSLMMLHSGVLATSGLIWAYTNRRNLDIHYPMTLLTNVLSIVMWLLIFLFPLIQAARLSSACHCIKKLGLFLLTRPFGYQDTSQIQLDSFLLYTSSLEMQAKLFHVPVKPPVLFGIMTITIFVILLLSQLEIISITL